MSIEKRVKIVATIGPATDSLDGIFELAKEGVDVFRLNLSHRNREESEKTIKNIREIEKKLGRPLAIMGDLAGLKIRIGDIEDDCILKTESRIKIDGKKEIGNQHRISLNFPEILKNVKKGAEIYLGDGSIRLEIEKVEKDGVVAEVKVGGPVRPRMGFSVQGLILNKNALTLKDKKDIKDMMELGIDALAVSFVQTKRDIQSVLNLLPKEKTNRPMIIAKIETMGGVENAEEILGLADGLMVARGDLGLAVPLPELPHIQKYLIELSLSKAKPVITATQMLESMNYNPLPTRAEVTDVANAILDGTDAVMLSGETATGKFPKESVKMMVKIIEQASPRVEPFDFYEGEDTADAISASVVDVADQIGARLIIVLSQTGFTARKVSRHRDNKPIIALTSEKRTLHKMNFSYNVYPMQTDVTQDFSHLVDVAKKVAQNNPIIKLKKGESFVISAGIPFGEAGTTNLVLVQKV